MRQLTASQKIGQLNICKNLSSNSLDVVAREKVTSLDERRAKNLRERRKNHPKFETFGPNNLPWQFLRMNRAA